VTTDHDIFNGFVFEGRRYPREAVEQATQAVQQGLTPGERRRANNALLERLADAKEKYRAAMREHGGGVDKREMLRDPYISTLVNTLVLVNEGWVKKVILKNIERLPHLHGFSAEELGAAALAGRDASDDSLGGVINAILEYKYQKELGAASFTAYVERAISNSLQQTPKQQATYRRIYARMQPINGGGENGAGGGWIDRSAAPPEERAINDELLEVVRSVIPRLPSAQQRFTAAWLVERILATGERPTMEEVAQAQHPPVSKQRGAQILTETVDSIRRRIEADYPQLAKQGINGWTEFKRAFSEFGHTTSRDDAGNGRM
jgi:hypothetical protein